MSRKLLFGMIGGGRGAFIGGVHRIAAQMDGLADLVAGAFSSDAQRARASAGDLGIDPDRAYGDHVEMAAAEREMAADERLDFVVIVTPNHLHFPVAKCFLEAGFNVVCDKPVTLTLEEALQLREIVTGSRRVFVLTHNYTGNAMVKQARELVSSGGLGKVRKVIAEYSQGWLARDIENSGQKQAEWRTDPARSGAAGCLGDIGTHAENLARYITGLRISELCAELTTFVPGRRLEDDANTLLRFEGGARGILHCSQIAVGEENNLSIRVYGTEGSLEWQQEHPNELVVKFNDKAREVWRRGNGYVGEAARQAARIPSGHPEGYLEAFANIYREAFRAIAAQVQGAPIPANLDFPTIEEGVEGMRFLKAALESSSRGGQWVKL